MSALFINGSPNKNGNTAKLASRVLKGKEYETINCILTDRILKTISLKRSMKK